MVSEKSKLIAKILNTINTIDFHLENMELDVLGDAYEYLIGMFAQTAGKKAENSILLLICQNLLQGLQPLV